MLEPARTLDRPAGIEHGVSVLRSGFVVFDRSGGIASAVVVPVSHFLIGAAICNLCACAPHAAPASQPADSEGLHVFTAGALVVAVGGLLSVLAGSFLSKHARDSGWYDNAMSFIAGGLCFLILGLVMLLGAFVSEMPDVVAMARHQIGLLLVGAIVAVVGAIRFYVRHRR